MSDNSHSNQEFLDSLANRYRQQEIANIYQQVVLALLSTGKIVDNDSAIRYATIIWETKRKLCMDNPEQKEMRPNE